jgi:hypothetical protein
MVGYHKRSDPATMWAKDQIEQFKQSGEIGKLNYIRLVMPAGDWIANGFSELITAEDTRAPGGGRSWSGIRPPRIWMRKRTEPMRVL